MSKLGADATFVHIMGCNLTGTSGGYEVIYQMVVIIPNSNKIN